MLLRVSAHNLHSQTSPGKLSLLTLFLAIETGIYGFPLENPLNASKVALVPVPTLSEMTKAFLNDTAPTSSDIITIVIGGDDVSPLRLPLHYVALVPGTLIDSFQTVSAKQPMTSVVS